MEHLLMILISLGLIAKVKTQQNIIILKDHPHEKPLTYENDLSGRIVYNIIATIGFPIALLGKIIALPFVAPNDVADKMPKIIEQSK